MAGGYQIGQCRSKVMGGLSARKTSLLVGCLVMNSHRELQKQETLSSSKLTPEMEETRGNSLQDYFANCERWIIGTRPKTEGSLGANPVV